VPNPDQYRQRRAVETWHFCSNCSNWPGWIYHVSYEAEQRKPMQGVPGEACGWDLPLARSFRPFRSLHSFTMLARTASNG
jgi:hypothetical protein